MRTPLGDVRGLIRSKSSGVAAGRVFFGVPFALPPTGDRRFRPAQPPEKWAPKTLDARGTRDRCAARVLLQASN